MYKTKLEHIVQSMLTITPDPNYPIYPIVPDHHAPCHRPPEHKDAINGIATNKKVATKMEWAVLLASFLRVLAVGCRLLHRPSSQQHREQHDVFLTPEESRKRRWIAELHTPSYWSLVRSLQDPFEDNMVRKVDFFPKIRSCSTIRRSRLKPSF